MAETDWRRSLQQLRLHRESDQFLKLEINPIKISFLSLSLQRSWSNRFEVILEAGTAVAQSVNEDPLAYLNKGQVYNIVLRDKGQTDELFTTSLCVCFHELKYQREEEATWKTWLAQQSQPALRPIELGWWLFFHFSFSSNECSVVDLVLFPLFSDRKASAGITSVDCTMFNTVLFSWNGKKGATVAVRFNCLSTEFIKCKGVKGVQLRLQAQIRDSRSQVESSCCRIKVFRDKVR